MERTIQSYRFWTAVGGLVLLLALLFLLPASPLHGVLRKSPPAAEADQNAFAPRVEDVAADRRAGFTGGARMFTHHWTPHTPGGKDVDFDGLGPVFNQTSCIGCHVKGGRGRPPEKPDQAMDTMVIRLSLPGTGSQGAPGPAPAYGSQLNTEAIPGVPAEGRATLDYEELPGTYGDGAAFSLARPNYRLTDLAFGPLDGVLISPRVAQPMIGLGLLEAVPAATLEAIADAEDANGDGVSGRLNWVVDPKGAPVAGRFGWKAKAPTLLDQAADAGLEDMGLTSFVHPDPNCMPVQTACAAAAVRQRPDMSDRFFKNLVTYLEMTTVPARRGAGASLARGEALFNGFGCAECHRPTLSTADDAPLPELRGRTFQPYTDLLLHDMGEGLADHRPEGSASGSEWRTAPLWGIGLTMTLNGHERFLHDGRARGFAEAILWHGGEAERAREAFRTATAADRDALVEFLRSL